MRVKFFILTMITAANLALGQYGPISPQPGMPFSADHILTQVQILPDGKRVAVPDQISKHYRNSLGLTRLDMYVTPASAAQRAQPVIMNITIFDPINGARYLLNPNKKTALKFPLPKRSELANPLDLLAAVAGILIGPTEQAGAAGTAPPSGHRADESEGPPSQNESLGTKTIEGVTAVGRRTTMTYAPDKTNNNRGFVTIFEAWESPELGMMMVLTKHSDSRSGELTTRLTNIRRTEPDPSLFVVPADYTIEANTVPAAPSSGQRGAPAR